MKVTLDTPLFLERSIRKFEKLLDVYERQAGSEMIRANTDATTPSEMPITRLSSPHSSLSDAGPARRWRQAGRWRACAFHGAIRPRPSES